MSAFDSSALEQQWLKQKETVLAWIRVGFAAAAIAVIQINPLRASRFPVLSSLTLVTFLLYSLAVLYMVKRATRETRRIGFVTTVFDLVWISLIALSTGGSRTPFFVYYLFPIITASSRYGIKGGLLTAACGVFVYGAIRFSPIWDHPLGIDFFIIRSIYLVVLAYVFGFLSEFERRQNQMLMTLYKTVGETATLEERKRISRELHDRLLQALVSFALRLETCRRHLLNRPGDLERELELMEEHTRSSMHEIRGFLSGRSDPILARGTIIERLKHDLKFLRDGLGIKAVLESDPEEIRLPEAIEEEVYRILREGLINVSRHSQASKTEIQLKEKGGSLLVSLEDDGVGFDPVRARLGNGYGLAGMEEWAEKIGGRLRLQAAPGKGAKISLEIPLTHKPG
jgi:signal transduction histidine kinase